MKFKQKSKRNQRGAALLEYALVVSGVALVTVAAVAIFGHKTNDLIASTAAVLPGAHADDNGPIFSGKIIETTGADTGQIAIDIDEIVANGVNQPRLGNNLGIQNLDTLVLDEPVTPSP